MLTVLMQQLANGLIVGGIYSLTAAGLSLTWGVLSVLNLAQGEMYALGAYLAFVLVMATKLPYWLSLVGSFVALGLVGLVAERVALRPVRKSGVVYGYITTFAVSFILQNLLVLIWKADPRIFPTAYADITLNWGGVTFTLQQLIVFVTCWVIIGLLYYLLNRTKMGLAIRSVSQNEDTSNLMGIPVNWTIAMTFALACGLAGIAGALIGPTQLLIPSMGAATGIKLYAVILIGGLGNVFGTVMAGFLLGAVEGICNTFITSTFRDVLPFVVIIVVLVTKPNGLFTRSAR